MSLFPIAETTDPAAEAAKKIAARMNRAYADMLSAHQDVFDAFWYHPQVTPQQMADALMAMGAPPAAMFQLGGGLVGLVLSAKPDAIPKDRYTPPSAVTFKQDGSVTIS